MTDVYSAMSLGVPFYLPGTRVGRVRTDEPGDVVCNFEVWCNSSASIEDDIASHVEANIDNGVAHTPGVPLGDADKLLAATIRTYAGVPEFVIGKAQPDSEYVRVQVAVRCGRAGAEYGEAKRYASAILALLNASDGVTIPSVLDGYPLEY